MQARGSILSKEKLEEENLLWVIYIEAKFNLHQENLKNKNFQAISRVWLTYY